MVLSRHDGNFPVTGVLEFYFSDKVRFGAVKLILRNRPVYALYDVVY